MDDEFLEASNPDANSSQIRKLANSAGYGTVSFVTETTLVEPDGFMLAYPAPYFQYSDFEIWTKADNNGTRGVSYNQIRRTSINGAISPPRLRRVEVNPDAC